MNMDKTKVIWRGRKKYSKDKLNATYNLIWGDEEFDLLGITFSVDLNTTTIKNYQKAQVKINESIKSWDKTYLTPLYNTLKQKLRTYAINFGKILYPQ